MRITEETKRAVRLRFDFCCGYCGVSETNTGAELTIDHFQPRSRGGSDSMENLIYCCHACNQFKGDYWQPDSEERVLHPIRDALLEHLAEVDNGILQGNTATGAFHISHLHLNRFPLLARRREQQAIAQARKENDELRREIEQLEQQMQELTQSLSHSAD